MTAVNTIYGITRSQMRHLNPFSTMGHLNPDVYLVNNFLYLIKKQIKNYYNYLLFQETIDGPDRIVLVIIYQ